MFSHIIWFYDAIWYCIDHLWNRIFLNCVGQNKKFQVFCLRHSGQGKYVNSSSHFSIIKIVLRHRCICDLFMMIPCRISSNFVTFVVFCYGKSHKVYGNSWFSPRIFVLTGSKNLQCSMCNLLCVVELWRHNGRKVPFPVLGLLRNFDF